MICNVTIADADVMFLNNWQIGNCEDFHQLPKQALLTLNSKCL
jgi:hypothetical protein